jgi:ornithine carbamoyltransferase
MLSKFLKKSPRHLKTISDVTPYEIMDLIDTAKLIKSSPQKYLTTLKNKTLLMFFEKPSLRTRISFETGMTQLGGHAIYYQTDDGPLGTKESISDTAIVSSKYVDGIIARVKKREMIRELAHYSSVPVINALDDFAHPCQILADLMTISEKLDTVSDFKMTYFGDLHNNVTYDLMRASSMLGFELNLVGPNDNGPNFSVESDVIEECLKLNNIYTPEKSFPIDIITNPEPSSYEGSHVIYCDSWMSYGIPKDHQKIRKEIFLPYQVTEDIMKKTSSNSIFMNCLPAIRGMEQTKEVIDGDKSVVYNQADNRLYIQKALLIFLLG